MKHTITRTMTAVCAVGWLTSAAAQEAAPAATPASTPTAAPAPAVKAPETRTPAPFSPDEIRLNFRNAPLELVLEYLSEAAGFIIVLDAPAKGTVNIISSRPVSSDEAVDLLNSVLNKNGLAAIRDGKTLTIVDRVTAKTRDIPVKVNNNPASIPKNDEIVTQIIPIRFVEADQLVKDLNTFISPQATFVANTAGNSIVMTDTQANIRHMVEIIKAIDTSAEAETQIRVFRLKHASPADVASALSSVFPSSSSGGGANNSQAPVRFGGFGGFPGFGGGGFGGGGFGGGAGAGGGRGGGGGGGASGSTAQNARIQRASQVLAVSDPRTSSVIVTASKDLMSQIEGMVKELDVPAVRDQQVYVFHMTNGDAQQALQVLQNMFQTSTTSRSGSTTSSQNSALMQRQQNNTTTTGTTTSGSFGSGSSGGRTGGGNLF